MLIGYARVSTDEQNPEAQTDALTRAGVAEANLYVDYTSGVKSSRPQWDLVQRVLRDGDALVATRLDRVCRSTAHLVQTLDEFRQRGVAFKFLEQGIDTTTAEGRMVYRMLAVAAEFQRDLITANTREGLAAARARGRKPKLSSAQVKDTQDKYDSREWTVQQIADLYGVPRTTVYNYLHTSTNDLPSWDDFRSHATDALTQSRRPASDAVDWLHSDWHPASTVSDSVGGTKSEVFELIGQIKELTDRAKGALDRTRDDG